MRSSVAYLLLCCNHMDYLCSRDASTTPIITSFLLIAHCSLLIAHQAQRSAHHFYPALHAVAVGVGEEVVVHTSGLTGGIPLIVVGGRVEYFLAPA